MKRLLFVLVLLALVGLLVSPVMGAYNFQSVGDMLYVSCDGGGCTWYESSNGGNNYGVGTYVAPHREASVGGFGDYLAVSYSPPGLGAAFRANIKDQTGATSGTIYTSTAGNARAEIIKEIDHSITWLKLYRNGVEVDSINVTHLEQDHHQYMSDVTFVTYAFDDITNTPESVLGGPDPDTLCILKDTITPGASGLARLNDSTVVNSATIPISVSRPAIDLENKTISLIHAGSGSVYGTTYSGTGYWTTSPYFSLTDFFAADPPYGFYYASMDGAQDTDPIIYKGSGATITFDADSYSQGDTATITYTVEDDYFLPGTYDYSVKIYNGLTFEVMQTTTISFASGTTTYDFSESDDAGTYYAVLIATDKVSHAENWFALDWADLDAYVTFYGYVMNQDGTVLSGANVSITQGDLYDNEVTIADGNYTATGFYAGVSTILNVTASGHSRYNVSLVPPVAKRVYLNFTLNSTTPTVTGLGIGGVARDGIFNDTIRVITSGYGRPLSGATVYLWNFSNSQGYTKTTNIAGWYLCDDGSSCSLVPGRVYDVQGRKGGYNNSQNYTVVTS